MTTLKNWELIISKSELHVAYKAEVAAPLYIIVGYHGNCVDKLQQCGTTCH